MISRPSLRAGCRSTEVSACVGVLLPQRPSGGGGVVDFPYHKHCEVFETRDSSA